MKNIPALIEEYLIRGAYIFKKIDEKTWVIEDQYENIDNMVIHYQDPLIILRLKLMPIPESNREEFYEKLLRLNAESLVHGAYALEGNNVIIVDTLEGENLDFNELQASIDAIQLALANDYNQLKKYYKQ
ncbi:MAG TPA: hypothetical protein PKW55_07915 [Spirochaetota bacterium]|nr:hypothetical protein [Spirochaetota bacterium]HOM38833.1 hypothetical protein [Spirochaetota bacterium]HPQ49891.1 hypothetical protein [Spirochaetota bacterium]